MKKLLLVLTLITTSFFLWKKETAGGNKGAISNEFYHR